MAINLYLAAKHGKDGFFPASLEDQALCHQWSFWGMTEVEKPLLTVLIDMFMTAPDKRKPEAVAEAQKALPKPFGVLNGALQGRDYLLGSTLHRGRPQPRLDLQLGQADQVRLRAVPQRRRLARPLSRAAGLQGGAQAPSRKRYSAGAARGGAALAGAIAGPAATARPE